MSGSTPKKKAANSLKDQINEDRLAEWRKSREKVAQTSKQERLRQAEAQKEARLEAFHEDQKQRIAQAAQTRARADAAVKAERLARVQAQIPSRVTTSAAANRIEALRLQRLRSFFAQACLFVLLPTLLVAGYLMGVATPLYEARTQLLVVRDMANAPTNAGGVFGTIRTPNGAADLVENVIRTGAALDVLDDRVAFSERLSAATVDPITRYNDASPLNRGRLAQLERFVKVKVNPSNDQAELSVYDLSPQFAAQSSSTLLAFTQNSLDQINSHTTQTAPVVMHPITETFVSNQPASPRIVYGTAVGFLFFAGLFLVGRIVITSVFLGVR